MIAKGGRYNLTIRQVDPGFDLMVPSVSLSLLQLRKPKNLESWKSPLLLEYGWGRLC